MGVSEWYQHNVQKEGVTDGHAVSRHTFMSVWRLTIWLEYLLRVARGLQGSDKVALRRRFILQPESVRTRALSTTFQEAKFSSPPPLIRCNRMKRNEV
jgi:hypothetical protein